MSTVKKLGVRHVQAVLLAGALMVNHMQLGNLGIAVVVLTQDTTDEIWKRIFSDTRIDKTSNKVTIITGSFFYSQMIFSIVGGYLCTKVNNKVLITSATGIGLMVCYLTPTLVEAFNWKAFLFVRLVHGAAQGFVKPVIYNLAARWLPTEEMLLLGPAILSGMYVGVCFMLMMGGYLGAGHGGWPSIFYFSANCAVLWTIAFLGLGFVSPNDCFYISDLEKNYINANVPPSVLVPYRKNIPWKKIFTNIPLFSLLICQIANNWSFHIFVKIWPIYLQNKLQYDLHETGIICGAPFLFLSSSVIAVTIFFYYLRKQRKLNHTIVRHICNGIAQFGAAYSFMICSASEKVIVAIIFHHLGIIVSSLQLFGYYMSFYDLSPTYIGLISGLVNGIANIGSIVGPHVTMNLYNEYGDNTEAWYKDREFIGWRKGYDFMSLNYFIAGSLFMFLMEVKEQDFDKNESRPKKK